MSNSNSNLKRSNIRLSPHTLNADIRMTSVFNCVVVLIVVLIFLHISLLLLFGTYDVQITVIYNAIGDSKWLSFGRDSGGCTSAVQNKPFCKFMLPSGRRKIAKA